MRPQFQFTADSGKADEKAGLAVWRYTVQQRGEDVEMIVRQRFDTFAAAFGMNDLIGAAWEAGIEAGLQRVCSAVDRTLRGYR